LCHGEITLQKDKESQYNIMTRDTYCKLLAEVVEAKPALKKTSLQYRRLKRFDVLEIGEVKKLIAKGETVRYFLPAEEIFDVIECSCSNRTWGTGQTEKGSIKEIRECND
jgi:hypothetical protein